MNSKLRKYGLALCITLALTLVAPAQESAAEKQREQQMDTAAAGNAYKEPHMAAALQHLRQAEEELEKANNEHGGFRQSALQQTQQAEQTVEKGIQWYNANVLNKNKNTTALGQESAAENAREKQMDTAAAGNAYKEPHMAAALSQLRQAEEELEKANNEHGGYRQAALKQTQEAEATVTQGIQWYNANVLNKKK
jgi:hypothetical protein